jgi:hypothetical protein
VGVIVGGYQPDDFRVGPEDFNVNATVRIGAGDTAGRENLARYLIRAPFSMNKVRYDPKRSP